MDDVVSMKIAYTVVRPSVSQTIPDWVAVVRSLLNRARRWRGAYSDPMVAVCVNLDHSEY